MDSIKDELSSYSIDASFSERSYGSSYKSISPDQKLEKFKEFLIKIAIDNKNHQQTINTYEENMVNIEKMLLKLGKDFKKFSLSSLNVLQDTSVQQSLAEIGKGFQNTIEELRTPRFIQTQEEKPKTHEKSRQRSASSMHRLSKKYKTAVADNIKLIEELDSQHKELKELDKILAREKQESLRLQAENNELKLSAINYNSPFNRKSTNPDRQPELQICFEEYLEIIQPYKTQKVINELHRLLNEKERTLHDKVQVINELNKSITELKNQTKEESQNSIHHEESLNIMVSTLTEEVKRLREKLNEEQIFVEKLKRESQEIHESRDREMQQRNRELDDLSADNKLKSAAIEQTNEKIANLMMKYKNVKELLKSPEHQFANKEDLQIAKTFNTSILPSRETAKLPKEYEEINQQLKVQSESYALLTTEVQLDKTLLTEQNSKLQHKLSKNSGKLHKLSLSLEAKTQEILALKSQLLSALSVHLHSIDQTKASFDHLLVTISTKISTLSTKIQDSTLPHIKFQQELEDTQYDNARLKGERETVEKRHEKELSHLNQLVQELDLINQQQQKDLDSAKLKGDNLHTKNLQLIEDLRLFKTDISRKTLKEEILKLKEIHGKLQNDIASLNQTNDSLLTQIETIKNDNLVANHTITELNKVIEAEREGFESSLKKQTEIPPDSVIVKKLSCNSTKWVLLHSSSKDFWMKADSLTEGILEEKQPALNLHLNLMSARKSTDRDFTAERLVGELASPNQAFRISEDSFEHEEYQSENPENSLFSASSKEEASCEITELKQQILNRDEFIRLQADKIQKMKDNEDDQLIEKEKLEHVKVMIVKLSDSLGALKSPSIKNLLSIIHSMLFDGQ